jgi:hypothetical protein
VLIKKIDHEAIKSSIPPSVFDNMNVSNIQKRKQGLDIYLSNILKNEQIKSSFAVESFLNIKRLRICVYEKKISEDEGESIFTQLSKNMTGKDHFDPSLPNSCFLFDHFNKLVEKSIIENNRKYSFNLIPPQYFSAFHSNGVSGFVR